ncbi:MAG: sigma-54-dependent Fis family transcriptional regulator [Verrucomicrobia bacterium]|nr:sigma-54-dependent Fis family transcriptional regulator [Verrucomicrobiota bacterium]MBV9299931.1 sigma-54-dependent Fis family transcriptional regulator [Verrucomicrobiota bacterium]MBV9644643.1 sigma-54-dependent Fis family transcriptional regulator [Verrucomicrobiota bacterium]
MRVLIIDDERSIRTSTAVAIQAAGHHADTADSGQIAILKLQDDAYDLAFLDLRLGDEDGLEILEQIKRQHSKLPVVVFTAYASVASAVAAMQRGAFDYLEKPFTPEHLRQIIGRVEKQRKLESKIDDLQEQINLQNPTIKLQSSDARMAAALDMLYRAAPTQAAILLLGENGTGKSVLAREVHRRSNCKEGPFVTVSCPSLSRELLESELFGHMKGAFTGAVRDTWGKVAAAESGTLFLDEIGELPLEIQPKLLRLLQDRQYERVGENKIRNANTRIIAATNKDLKECVRKGTFREDLYYRLDVISVTIPPLRERLRDLENLAREFLQFFASQFGRTGLKFSESALRKLRTHSWRGNIRELRNTIERAAILAQTDEIGEEYLPEESPEGQVTEATIGSEITLDQLEEVHIRSILQKAPSLDAAAKILGIDPATLYRKRKRLKL